MKQFDPVPRLRHQVKQSQKSITLLQVEDQVNQAQKTRFAQALKRLAGDEELLIAMGTMVLDDAPIVTAELQQQVVDGELAGAAATAHKLKGLLSTFDDGDCISTIQHLITSAKASDQSECQATWPKCERETESLLAEIRGVVDPVST